MSAKKKTDKERLEEDRVARAQAREVEAMMQGVPRLNVAALFMPPIWGPAHGIWITILYYPIWLLADSCFVRAVAQHTPIAIVFGVLVGLVLAGITIAFAVLGQPYALRRALDAGKTKEDYLRRQRIWAVACVALGVAALVLATWYNVFICDDLSRVFAGVRA